MDPLMISVSGIRGIVGGSLKPEVIMKFCSAFGTLLNKGRVVVGRDTRVSGLMAKHAVFSGLIATGTEIIDLGITTTPSVAILVEELGVDGGVMISASHNPIQWNALKFFGSDGMLLNNKQSEKLVSLYESEDYNYVDWIKLREPMEEHRTEEIHIRRVFELINVERIRKCKFKVIVDSANGGGASITRNMLSQLNCVLTELNFDQHGYFEHDPEPNAENLKELCAMAQAGGYDIGFAQDPDADRLAVVSEQGEFIGEEYTLAMGAKYLLSENPTDIVVNLSTSRMVDDVAAEYGRTVYRSPVGEANVVELMQKKKCGFGGEGNGGVIDARAHYGRDSLVGIALILDWMAGSGKTVSELIRDIPKYHMIKEKMNIPADKTQQVIGTLKEDIVSPKQDVSDGLRLDWEDRWIHLRPSNTEPVLRLIAEARTREDARSMIEEFKSKIVELS